LAFGAALAVAGPAALAQGSAPPPIDKTLQPYASTKDSVRLPDGRTIHLVCTGAGAPVVVLTAGGTGWSIVWSRVQQAVARKTRVCSWDPAGLGLSSASPKPQSSDNMTSDLQAALKARGIDGPYVVVGHSLGAYVSLILADREPSKVAGMVLVDPSIPDQTAIFDRITPAQSAWLKAHPDPLAPLLEKCVAGIRSGAIRPGADPDACLRPPGWPPDWPPELQAALTEMYANASPATIADRLETFESNLTSADRDAKVAIRPGRNYGSMPLIVLTASDFLTPRDYSEAAKAEIPAEQTEWRRGHDAYAALSTKGVDRIVPNSTHDMLDEKAEVVAGAIAEVVDDVLRRRSPNGVR